MKACAVYGVSIPGTEGKCGIVAIADPEGNLDLHRLTESVQNALPAYARLLFLRVLRTELNMTGRNPMNYRQIRRRSCTPIYFLFFHILSIVTFKISKVELRKEGYDPEKLQDALYFLSKHRYIPLESGLLRKIVCGMVKV
jgi:solute carrier family 27 fatty acid transporter 1/4